MDNFNLVIDLIAYSAIIPIGLFVYFYGSKPWRGHRLIRRPSTLWRTTAVGRTLMYQSIAWFAYLIFVAASLWFGDWAGRDILRSVIYIVLVVLFWRLFFVLRQAQKKRPNDPSTTGLTTDTEITHDPRKKN